MIKGSTNISAPQL